MKMEFLKECRNFCSSWDNVKMMRGDVRSGKCKHHAWYILKGKRKKRKAIPVTGREGP
jgi:hypothetical protein